QIQAVGLRERLLLHIEIEKIDEATAVLVGDALPVGDVVDDEGRTAVFSSQTLDNLLSDDRFAQTHFVCNEEPARSSCRLEALACSADRGFLKGFGLGH